MLSTSSFSTSVLIEVIDIGLKESLCVVSKIVPTSPS